VHINTADAIATLTATLANLPTPTGGRADRARVAAARHGWVALHVWYDACADIDDPLDQPTGNIPDTDEPDQEVVRRLLAGWEVSVSRKSDRLAAARVLLQRGMPRNQVSLRLRLRHSVVTEMASQLAA
jgi:hypothetical protein